MKLHELPPVMSEALVTCVSLLALGFRDDELYFVIDPPRVGILLRVGDKEAPFRTGEIDVDPAAAAALWKQATDAWNGAEAAERDELFRQSTTHKNKIILLLWLAAAGIQIPASTNNSVPPAADDSRVRSAPPFSSN